MPGWPLVMYSALVIMVTGGILGLSYVLGERHEASARGEPYESGVVPTDSARLRVSAQFYLVAMYFLIFDLEAAFIFAWAIALRQVGWAGYSVILVFIVALVVALIYLWRTGALDWGPHSRHTRRIQKE